LCRYIDLLDLFISNKTNILVLYVEEQKSNKKKSDISLFWGALIFPWFSELFFIVTMDSIILFGVLSQNRKEKNRNSLFVHGEKIKMKIKLKK